MRTQAKTPREKAPPPMGEGFGERVEKNRAAAPRFRDPRLYPAWQHIATGQDYARRDRYTEMQKGG